MYEENGQETVATGRFRVRLVRAFWSRADAADWARAEHVVRSARHYHVYRLVADERWARENSLTRVHHAVSFEDAGERPQLSVTAGAVAHALGD